MSGARYPSYVDLDGLIDVPRLRALDARMRAHFEQRCDRERDLRFYTGPLVMRAEAATVPGPRMVALTRSKREDIYLDLDRTHWWEPSAEAADFPELMAFIDTLPFKARGRILIIYDQQGRAVTAHRDHDLPDLCHEFVWFRTNLDKPFFMLDPHTGERLDVTSHAAWFDTVNQYHGADATGELAWSIRVDGVFTDEFRALIPFPAVGRAAAPALWAAQSANSRPTG